MSTAPRDRAWRYLAAIVIVSLVPFAPALAAATKGDPLEKLNRATYAFNDALDRMLARPVARAYVKVVPAPVRKAVSNFTANLTYPEVIINDTLQGKFKDAGSDFARLLINTTVGFGGFGDPATRWGFQSHDEDFGQTLGHWGVPPGPYFMIPILGPSDFRDAPGKLVDSYASPYTYIKSTRTKDGLYLLTPFNNRVELLAADTTLRNAYDPYAFVRNAYVARRNYLVHDGNVAEDNFEDPIGETAPAGAAPEAAHGAGGPAASTAAEATTQATPAADPLAPPTTAAEAPAAPGAPKP